VFSILVSLSFWIGAENLFLTSFSIPFSILGILLARSQLKGFEDANNIYLHF